MGAVIILVVEDEPIQRMMMADLVEEAGYEPLEASDADMAVDILEARADIRVVLTDVDMPGSMSGMKLAAAVRERWPPIEIIVTSAARPTDLDTLPVRSVFLPKPLKSHELVATLQKFAAET